MANDINETIGANEIKNGTIVVTVPRTGLRDNLVNNNHVTNLPNISQIQAKYDTKFDDPRYYVGDTSS